MEIELARVAGFCMGVKRAMEITLAMADRAQGRVYTYGPLIHNPSAIELLASRGVGILQSIPERGSGIVIIRAHGVPPQERAMLLAAGFHVVDATCPKVVKVQMLAKHFASKGYLCVLLGDRGHPEVKGIMGYAGEMGCLVSDYENERHLPCLPEGRKYIVLAQTTQDESRYEAMARDILARNSNGRVFHTICDSTHLRQSETRRIAAEVDAVVVVGGQNSANTRRLVEIVKEEGRPVIAIETENDLDRDMFAGFSRIGITGGASTPDWVIDRVASCIRTFQVA
jgi:4-hydroxy-3-methylbut-2-enyl diphosphate reductase